MSRPLSHLFPVACAALSLGFAACVGTIYDPMYTSHRNLHYKPPAAKKEASADEVLGAVDARRPSGGAEMPTDSAALPPPATGGDIPGLTPPPPAPEAGGAMTPPPLPPAN